ncbi:F5/8 type C domain-containing protein [Actinacidiphila yanglinensis]|uniref:F5/8 type C domain-containing protein n=1 Tax=Actinacidiphila yanglinensis TaxID=310779 RepID=A0A1H5X5P1_9ACTN|nr:discoidin domain-containing protein [Actinacidiphila yanglinensis]SEG06717.1 F5/8 type C domain-containing protein [Actinacidiphila yanglinensis]
MRDPELPEESPEASDQQPRPPRTTAGLSRRRFLAANSTVLAAFGAGVLLPAGVAAAAGPAGGTRGAGAGEDLALHRPVAVSSTAYAATIAPFAVDGLDGTGVRGSGWRAAVGDPQWITVDLQSVCTLTGVGLVFEAEAGDTPYLPPAGAHSREGSTGTEIQSSCAVAFTLEVSKDHANWQTVHEESDGAGGAVHITLDPAVAGRWIRMTATERSSAAPLGLNGLRVYGTAGAGRPAAEGWTDWRMPAGDPPDLAVAADGSVPIESGWALTADDFAPSADGAVLSGAGVDVSRWLPATVPGTVLAALVEQGKLPDPVVGRQNLEVPEALSRHSWWYRRSFRVPPGLERGPGRRVRLEFDGVNHHAEFWLNGIRLGEATHPYARAAFDITGALRPGSAENVLAVRVDPMPYPGSPADKGPSGDSWLDAGSGTMNRNAPTYMSVSGWDWMPPVRDRATGIWNHVRLRATGAALVADPRISTTLPDLPDLGTAEVTVVVPVTNTADSDQRVTVTAAFDGITVRKDVTVPAGKTSDVSLASGEFPALRITDPKLWWPNGYGDPALHDLTLTAAAGGATSDRRTFRFGMRQFDYAFSMPIAFVNGHGTQTVDFATRSARYVRVLAAHRATQYGVSMWTLSVYAAGDHDTDLARGRTATASSTDGSAGPPGNVTDGDSGTRWSSAYQDGQWIQVDLGDTVDTDRVTIEWETAYATDFTVQVSADGQQWTDAASVSQPPVRPLEISVNGTRVFCRGGNWGFDELLRRVLGTRTADTVALHRDQNFTMIRNWVGCSNREEFFAACDENGLLVWNDFWDGWSMDPPDHATYLALARDTLRAYRHHPSVAVWCGANEGAPPSAIDDGVRQAVADEAPDTLYLGSSADGVVKGHGPYGWTDPGSYFGTGNFGFHTEIGMPVLPVAETMRNLAGDEAPWPIGDVWGAHDWARNGAQSPQSYQAAIEDRLGTSADLDTFTTKAQLVNYENARAMFEAWTSALWDNASGLLLWMSHPAWYSTVWQTYDYDLDVNGFYHGARKACEPLHVQLRPADGQITAVNHTTAALVGATATATTYDLLGNRLADPVTATVDVAPSATAAGPTAAFTADLPALHLLRLELTAADGTKLSENTYWRYRQTSDLRGLNALAQTRVTVGSVRAAGPAGPGGHAGRGHGTSAEGGALTAVVRNTGATTAVMVRISLRDRTTDARVLPAYVSDNYLWLLPGEERTVTARWPHATRGGARPRIVAEGYNVRRTVAG